MNNIERSCSGNCSWSWVGGGWAKEHDETLIRVLNESNIVASCVIAVGWHIGEGTFISFFFLVT